jgi:osmotically-inducible protein OsmY
MNGRFDTGTYDRDKEQQQQAVAQRAVEEEVKRRVAERCPQFYLKDISFHFAHGVLTLRGRVPTFYLKQIVLTAVKDLDRVECIDDRMDVVSASGLSSVKPK